MIFTGGEWTSIGTGVGVVVVVLAAGYKWFKREEAAHPKLAQELENNIPHGILTAAEDVGKFAENLAASPLFAGLAAKGKLEAHHIIKKATDTAIGSEVKTIMLGAGKLYSEMSATEKVKAESALRLSLNAMGINLSDAEIKSAFADTEAAFKDATSSAFFKALFPPETAPAPEAQAADHAAAAATDKKSATSK